MKSWVLKITLLAFALQGSTYAGAQSSEPTTPAAQNKSTLDYDVFKNSIQPVFLKKREGGVMCANCHTVLPTRLHLVPFAAGAATWTEEQTRQNFQTVSALVTLGDPMHSKLLLHPLAPEAGGDPTHTGGKFWKTVEDPEWKMIAAWVGKGSQSASATTTAAADVPPLDYEFFKDQVEPIFLKPRPGHARCYVCHNNGAEAKKTNFRVELLLPGNSNWTEEQSRRNFTVISGYVTPGHPLESRLLMHALSPEAGGDPYHTGGRQFKTQSDPDWQVLAAWANGAKGNNPPAK
ncbi:MAG TPA: hypothetical protein VH079_07750 [Terriglobales bacterium]|nr:hypothetical protein [Terriglobales bacterium]